MKPETKKFLLSISVSEADANPRQLNLLTPVSVREINDFEATFGEIPAIYKEFLCKFGKGTLKVGRNGITAVDYANCFMGPAEMAATIRGETGGWNIYEEYIEPKKDIPFFDLNNEVFVFRRGSTPTDQVFSPFGVSVISPDFCSFVTALVEDTTFWTKRS